MTDTTVGSRRFEMGRVITRTFEVLGRNFVAFALLALLLGGLPNLLVGLVQMRFVDNQAMFQPEMIGGTIVGALVMLAAAFVLQASIVHATVTDLNGRRVVLGDSLKVGLRDCLPLFGLAILMGLGIMLGALLLIIPGLILTVVWSVAVPAKVVEKLGVLQAMQRSRDLTRGHRWPIFGLFVLYAIANWILSVLIVFASVPFTPLAPASAGAITAIGSATSIVHIVASAIVATISTLISTTGGAALYFELRGSREGVGPEALASVFD